MRFGITAGITARVIFSRTVTNRFYARRTFIFWNWFAIFIYELRSKGLTLDRAAARVAEVMKIKPADVWASGRYRSVVEPRSLLCYWAVRELKMPMSSLSPRLGMSIPGVSKAVKRGEAVAKANGYRLIA